MIPDVTELFDQQDSSVEELTRVHKNWLRFFMILCLIGLGILITCFIA